MKRRGKGGEIPGTLISSYLFFSPSFSSPHLFIFFLCFYLTTKFFPAMPGDEDKENIEDHTKEKQNGQNEKQNDQQPTGQLKLHLKGGMGFSTTVLAKTSTKIYKLLDAFCKEHKVDPKEHRLIFKDKVLHLDERLETYNVPSEATVNVVASQTGGGAKLK